MFRQLQNESQRYNFVITGKVCKDFGKDLAAKNLASVLKISLAKSISMLGGKTTCIMEDLPINSANKYMRYFNARGIESRVELFEPNLKNAADSHTSKSKRLAKHSEKKTTPFDIKINSDFEVEKLSPRLYLQLAVTAVILGAVSLLYLSVGCGLILFLIERIISLVVNGSIISISGFVFSYTLPLLFVAFLLILYFRPLFPKNDELANSVEVLPKQQPKLYSFIQQISKALNTPPPTKCFFNASANLSVTFESSIGAITRGRSQLTMGLNLFHMLKPAQLVGLISANLWYFREARSKYLIAFAKYVHKRSFDAAFNKDGWVDWVNQRQDTAKNIVEEFLFSILKVFLCMSSKFFLVFHMPIAAASAGLLRKIQQLADDCATRICGSTAYKNSFLLLERAQYAQNEVLRNILNAPGPLRLVRDLPSLTSQNLHQQSNKLIEIIKDDIQLEEQRWYHNKPATHERMQRAADLKLNATVESRFASINLIEKYTKVSEEVSQGHYESQGLYINSRDLIDLEEYTESTKQEKMRQKKMQVYFNSAFLSENFWQFPSVKSAMRLSTNKKVSLLNSAIAQLRSSTPDYMKVQQDIPMLKNQVRKLSIANEIRKAGYGVPAVYFDAKKNGATNFADYFTEIKGRYIRKLGIKNKYCELMGLRVLVATSLANKKEEALLGYKIIGLLRELARLNGRLEKLQMAVSFLPIAEARIKQKKESNHRVRMQKIFHDVLLRCDEVFRCLREHSWPICEEHTTAEDFLLTHTECLQTDENYSSSTIVDYYQKVVLAMESANSLLNTELSLIAYRYESLYKIDKLKIISIVK